MQKDGQPNSTLAERLALKLERERQQVEALTENELRILGENLKNVSKDVLRSMQNDRQVVQQQERQRDRPLTNFENLNSWFKTDAEISFSCLGETFKGFS